MTLLIHYETLVGQVGAEGVTCLLSLAIESPQPIDTLAELIRRKRRYAKEVLERCLRYGYAEMVAPLDATIWSLTSKGREMLGAFFRLFLGRGSDPHQLSLPLPGSDPVSYSDNPARSDLAPLEVDVARGARTPIIHSDQIRIDPDLNSESEMNERVDAANAPRDLQAVAAALDRHHIRDLPGKPNRTRLLTDPWVTPERVEAAMTRAQNNPLRKSPSPIGLAVAELLAHRVEIDAMVETLCRHEVDDKRANEQSDLDGAEDGQIVPTDDPMAKWWVTAKGELSLEMTRATFETWIQPAECVDYEAVTGTYIVAVPNRYSQEWLGNRLRQSVERILSGMNGKPMKVEFVVWKEWRKQHR